MDNTLNDRRLSIHEAGHAVCALLYGRRWGCCLCGPNKHNVRGLAGEGDLTPTAEPTADEVQKCYPATDPARELVDEAVLSVAGHVAERLDAARRFYRATAPHGPRPAMIGAACRALLCGVSDDTTEAAFEDFCAAAARRLLGPHLGAIRAVADELLVRRRLTAGEVASIFQSHGQGGCLQ